MFYGTIYCNFRLTLELQVMDDSRVMTIVRAWSTANVGRHIQVPELKGKFQYWSQASKRLDQ